MLLLTVCFKNLIVLLLISSQSLDTCLLRIFFTSKLSLKTATQGFCHSRLSLKTATQGIATQGLSPLKATCKESYGPPLFLFKSLVCEIYIC